MPQPLPIQFSVASFPANFSPVDLDTFSQALAARLQATPFQSYGLFVTGASMPSTNVGPWLRDNPDGTRTWWFWNDNVGTYQSAAETGGYFHGAVSNTSTYQFGDTGNWVALNAFRNSVLDNLSIYDQNNSRLNITQATAGVWQLATRFFFSRTAGSTSVANLQVRFQATSRTVWSTQVYTSTSSATMVDVQTPPLALINGDDIRVEVNIGGLSDPDTWTVGTGGTARGGHFSGRRLV
jgi:hypothetical protein